MHQGTLPARVETFIRRMGEAKGLDEIFDVLVARLQQLGFERFAYQLIWPPRGAVRPLCITNYPEAWGLHYGAQDMASHDYVGRFSASSIIPFLWHELTARIKLTKRQRLVFLESTDAGLRAGGTVPIHGPGACKATFSVANDMKEGEFTRLFMERRHEIQLMATYAHEKIIALDLHEPVAGIVSLTPREVEVLTWMARGKSRWEAGVILGIKEDTVRAHLENLRMKLNAANTSNAIATAMLNGLIFP